LRKFLLFSKKLGVNQLASSNRAHNLGLFIGSLIVGLITKVIIKPANNILDKSLFSMFAFILLT
jgi:hypothetical protein